MKSELINYLSQFMLENRVQIFEDVLKMRTRYLTVVLEDLYQAQNASAVLRTCECFGIQDIHVIENRNKFIVHREIAMGSHKWLNLYKYKLKQNNTRKAIETLRNKNYRIIATSPDPSYPLVQDVDVSKGKMALFFGTEISGISDIIKENADEFIRVPMLGFTESFNISVSVALCLQVIVAKLHGSEVGWHLTPEEYSDLLLDWMRFSIKKVELLEKRFNSIHNQ